MKRIACSLALTARSKNVAPEKRGLCVEQCVGLEPRGVYSDVVYDGIIVDRWRLDFAPFILALTRCSVGYCTQQKYVCIYITLNGLRIDTNKLETLLGLSYHRNHKQSQVPQLSVTLMRASHPLRLLYHAIGVG